MGIPQTGSAFKKGFHTLWFELCLGLVRVLPRPVFALLVRGVIAIMYATFSKLQKNAQESLEIAFGSSLTSREKQRIARESFYNLAGGIAWFIYGIQHRDVTVRTFVVEGQEHLDRAMQRGKGAVIAIGHYGPFAWMIQYFAFAGYPAHVLMRAPRSYFLKEKFLESRDRLGLRLIYSTPIRQCITECHDALAQGGMIFMPIDQNYGASGRIFVDFFGHKVGTAPGAASYAIKTGAALLMAFCVPLPDGRFKIVIEPEIRIDPPMDDQATQMRYMALLTARLEGLIRERPEQWSWMHRRWKAVPRDGEI